MNSDKLSSIDLCRSFMHHICRGIHISASAKVDLLRNGPQDSVEQDAGKNLLQLRQLGFTDEQLAALERVLVEAQVDTIAYLFALIDQGTADERWPEALRLVNLDTNEHLGAGRLEWVFNDELLDYQEKQTENETSK